ncbi:MAG: SWIM zinc finger family protein [Alphaproteobacteria bacterium]|nr:SWIM zinc finger family protein [Alphaproteobacteria bacterium]
MTLTVDKVLAMAPDEGAAVTARRSARPSLWSDTGRHGAAIWGTCAGMEPFLVEVDLDGPAFRCTCPSPKKPCRHALALMLLQATTGLPERPAPERVSGWLSRRSTQQRSKGRVDQAARDKREQARVRKVEAGLEALKTWLCDRVRLGIAELESRPPSFWREQAARMEDAQLKGLPERILAIEQRIGAAPGWPEDVLAELGSLALLVEAWRHREDLPEPLLAGLRGRLGWSTPRKAVLEEGERVEDRWLVVGARAQETLWVDGLTAHRSWLVGARTGQRARVLRFEHRAERMRARLQPPRPDELPLLPGQRFEGTLAFFPGPDRDRALVCERRDAPGGDPLPHAEPISAALEGVADALARDPWRTRHLLLLGDVTPAPSGAGWVVADAADALPLGSRSPWTLLALSGGRPLSLAAEWDGAHLHPLGVAAAGRFHPLED